MLGISQKLLDEAFEIDATVATPQAFRHCGAVTTTHTVQWGLGVSAGTVEIESAPSEAYTGDWAPVATVVYAGGAPKVESVTVAGTAGAFRHRISSPVLDGTVTSNITGSL